MTVGTILGMLANSNSCERIIQAYPYLVAKGIDAALAYAAWRLEEREEPLLVLSVEWVAGGEKRASFVRVKTVE
ncbi:MAG: DUF433 domain-containing protein [Gemmataceae bacterium]